MHDRDDPLWQPGVRTDVELERIERRLAPFAARHRPALRKPPTGLARASRWPRRLAIAAGCVLALAAAWQWRFHWPEGQAWPTRLVQADGRNVHGHWPRDGAFATRTGETATIDVARIGRMKLAPDTRLRLVETRSGRHRVALDVGRIEATVWAPPGQFGVHSGEADIVDLGCAFTLSRDRDGRGVLQVSSGWVQYELGRQEVLLPAGYRVTYDDDGASLPVSSSAGRDLLAAAAQFDAAAGPAERESAIAALAASARRDDAYTLLHLLTRDPGLARGPLYPRLAELLGVKTDPDHRARWARGDLDAINAWWSLWPVPPKAWWRQWRDAFSGS